MNIVDLSVKWAVAAAVAAVLTRRVTPAYAAAAHRVWLLVLLSPVWWLAGEWLFAPAVLFRLTQDAVPPALAERAGGGVAVFLWIHAAVAAALLSRVAAGVWSVSTLLRAVRRLPAGEEASCARIIGEAAGRVREGRLAVPVTAGFLRPVIVLPAGWRSLPDEAVAAILHHEAAHVRRRDCARGLAAAVIEALFWFHPAAWLAASRVRWFAEMACDADAARAMDGRAYAASLLSLATGWRESSRPRYALLAGAGSNVGRRIHLLLDDLDHARRRRPLLAAAALFILLAIPASGLIEVGHFASDAPAPPGPFAPHAHDHGPH